MTDAKWAKQIAEELRYMREVLRENDTRPSIFASHKGGACGLNSRVDGILVTAAMLLERFPEGDDDGF